MKINRHYYKCNVCLSTFVVENENKQKLECFVCSSFTDSNIFVEWMGRVEGDMYLKEEEKCACDERCTCARGPKCVCKCGGKNHGTGAVVLVVVEKGRAMVKATDPEEAEDRCRKYFDTKKYLDSVVESLPYYEEFGKKFLQYGFWKPIQECQKMRSKILSLRSESGRKKALEKFKIIYGKGE
jgi:hypothetical protein